MHASYCLSRPIHLSLTTTKRKSLLPTSASTPPSPYPAPGGYPSTTQLPLSVSEQQPQPIAVTGTTLATASAGAHRPQRERERVLPSSTALPRRRRVNAAANRRVAAHRAGARDPGKLINTDSYVFVAGLSSLWARTRCGRSLCRPLCEGAGVFVQPGRKVDADTERAATIDRRCRVSGGWESDSVELGRN
ncbi:hypothetical protein C8R45DRAFT_499487 [Mycena sanguinolenta]|nr:hypothetical protein C8R45DRAFT_499487 [Mycena sanguinolenta]